jgi:hypothetical protein
LYLDPEWSWFFCPKASLNELELLLIFLFLRLPLDSRQNQLFMLRFTRLLAFLLIGMFLCGNLAAQPLPLHDWTSLSEDSSTVAAKDTIFLEKPCVKLDGHSVAAIWNKSLHLTNFRIEFDMASGVMAGLGFHVQDEQNYQFLYFRPGYGGTGEAIQYIPIYNGALSWVFYSEYQASADIHKMQWFHAAIEVVGDQLKVFTNGSKNPDLSLKMLRAGADRGSVMLRTLFREAYFANFTYRALPEAITDWSISEQLPAEGDYVASSVKRVAHWKSVDEAGDAYVNLCRYFARPEGVVIARHVLHADSMSDKTLLFDFTGTMRVFVNGKELFHYDKQSLDLVKAGTYKIRLPLQKGDNELVFITKGDGFIFGKGYNSMGRRQHQNWGFTAAVGD